MKAPERHDVACHANPRRADVHRTTTETDVKLSLILDGTGARDIRTPLPFLNHMLEALARHGLFDLSVLATGDIEVDAHHLVEDLGLVLGMAFKQALGERQGLVRYGSATIPMDETLATCAVDFGGRPAFAWKVVGLEGKWVGGFDCELAKEFFCALASRAECNLHLLLHYGDNAHHILEALFKAFARAADMASRLDPRIPGTVPSTKGTLTR
ncbi:MAG: imidazoleglycerol-phosphate dehydratase HisB [Deltaproteobacteria bacterium]|nr:imidazoleglycerol-phosphate dehydratase HisB [Deltaproteobacteria bacterium]